jgi:hypothetical protein
MKLGESASHVGDISLQRRSCTCLGHGHGKDHAKHSDGDDQSAQHYSGISSAGLPSKVRPVPSFPSDQNGGVTPV